MVAFTITATLDDRGRITVPAALRDRADLEPGDTVQVRLAPVRIDRIRVDGPADARDRLDGIGDARAFTYRDGILEVVRDA